MRYEAHKLTLSINGTTWEARGRRLLEAGWTAVFADEDEDAQDQSLPALKEGDIVHCHDVQTLKKRTTPPARFTEGTLIEAMAHVHRFVADADAKAVLRENEGIGTEATRAAVIETLKQRGYLQIDRKAIVASQLGKEIVAMTPDMLKDPVTTAAWESRLEAVAQGKESLSSFMEEQARVLPDLMQAILGTAPTPAFPCPSCGKALNRRKGKKAGTWFWGCTGYPSCSTTMPDSNGKPGTPRKRAELTQYSCSSCGKPLVQRSGAKGAFFGCSGYPGCKQTWPVGADGAPNFTPKQKRQ
ncbi:MAG: topoisomerase DNA-binding C4 zinc finger domain-containing protein [Desulfovibrio sp.]|nr:topoisomerase DNA-binding C4 zinc finger domain-containing protein [Desulfovibrio sp.]